MRRVPRLPVSAFLRSLQAVALFPISDVILISVGHCRCYSFRRMIFQHAVFGCRFRATVPVLLCKFGFARDIAHFLAGIHAHSAQSKGPSSLLVSQHQYCRLSIAYRGSLCLIPVMNHMWFTILRDIACSDYVTTRCLPFLAHEMDSSDLSVFAELTVEVLYIQSRGFIIELP